MMSSIGTDYSLNIKRPNRIANFRGAQSIGSNDQSSHALFKPHITFQLALLQLLNTQHLSVQLCNICIDLMKACVTNLLQFVEAYVRMSAKCFNIPIDTDYGGAEMLNSSGNTSLKVGHQNVLRKRVAMKANSIR
jgi:hypothetical protein